MKHDRTKNNKLGNTFALTKTTNNYIYIISVCTVYVCKLKFNFIHYF